MVPPVVKPVIRAHLEDLDRKIQPGMVLLTWQSMNIDGYLLRVHSGIVKLEELLSKIADIMENRIEFNLKHISRTMMVDLPSDQEQDYCRSVPMVGVTQVWCTNKDDLSLSKL